MTGLESTAQPFIRYRTGDVVQMSGDHCSARRGLHVIEKVLGRTTDFLVRSDGTIMHALAAIYVLRAVEGVGEFKLIQHTPIDIEVQVVPDGHWNDSERDAIIVGLKQRMGNTARIELKLLERIPPEASGKHRYVVSRVPLPAGLNASNIAEQ